MTKQDINHIYEESVYQIRLKVAIGLLAVPGITHADALKAADDFVRLLMSEDSHHLIHEYPRSNINL